MILNKGGKLSVEYFLSYLELVSNARQCSTAEVYDIVFDRLFDQDETKLGQASFQAFNDAYEQFTKKPESI
ncbi:hypothetical protein AB1K91_18595 [Terribacillus sp. 179-K 1B1 HS]|uniref:Uncharacterized protein n=1 Tax=Terribacillus halophilus TaxID=361279 RepID=A0A1G6T2G3_9BACI|nr:hypothetical protein [Terribacillus halophilus]SDD23238.1 hypothetical protein SAMN05421663_10817 [Terribacillus halophilus]